MSSNRKTARQPVPAKVRPVPVMLDLVRDGTRLVKEADDPERSAYVRDATGANVAVERGTERAMARMGGRRDPAVWLNDLMEIDDNPYISYADGMTRCNKAHADGSNVNAAIGRELRPGFVSFLVRRLHQNDEEMSRHVVASLLEALRSAGEQEQKWAAALALRLGWGLTQAEIARDLQVDQKTVSTYLRHADAWLREHLERQPWIQAYLSDAQQRYGIEDAA